MVKKGLPPRGYSTIAENSELALAPRIALGWTTDPVRTVLVPLFTLDERLARIVATVREPLLAQMRLAWWRDRLGEAPASRPTGDPALDAIGALWQGEEAALIALVDGWEELLGEAPLSERAFERFAAGRGAGFAACARRAGQGEYAPAAEAAGARFALGDCFAHLSDAVERDRVRAAAAGLRTPRDRLPRSLRPLTILGGLGARVLRRGEGPLFGDRGSALLATRLGIWGR